MITLQAYFEKLGKLRGEDLSASDEELIGTAFNLAKDAHNDQKRASGEEYFDGHCVPVSYNVASIGMDCKMIAAALLHDTIEDTAVTYEDLVLQCGDDVANMVDGVSKLGKVRYQGTDSERMIESLRKFFVAIAKDARVVILKLCDRWHNLETLIYLPEEKRSRIAQESILIHAQLASRLGMGKLASIIKDLAFPYAYPDEYDKTRELLEEAMQNASQTVQDMYEELGQICAETLNYRPEMDKRIKGLYSSYKKLTRRDWDVGELYDLVALRVIVESTEDCYRLLGAIHSRWQPLPGRLKDHIAMPKPNGYRSLHTTVMSGKGLMVEIQIRTRQMHEHNEYGIAAHHTYKNIQSGEANDSFDWLSQLGQLKDEELTPEEYIQELRSDFFEDRIFALTPQGDVVDLPTGATVLDFAYSIHSDIGDSAGGGRINGKYCALGTPIPSESVVEIVTNSRTKPSEKWIQWVKTSRARTKIKKRLGDIR